MFPASRSNTAPAREVFATYPYTRPIIQPPPAASRVYFKFCVGPPLAALWALSYARETQLESHFRRGRLRRSLPQVTRPPGRASGSTKVRSHKAVYSRFLAAWEATWTAGLYRHSGGGGLTSNGEKTRPNIEAGTRPEKGDRHRWKTSDAKGADRHVCAKRTSRARHGRVNLVRAAQHAAGLGASPHSRAACGPGQSAARLKEEAEGIESETAECSAQ